jgi:hypothetical protein
MSNPKAPKATPTATRDQLQTIDPAALTQVSGGAATTTSSNDQVLTALTGILDSLQSLASQKTNNSGGFNQQEMLMLMMMMQQRNQQQAAVAATSAWPWSQEPIVRYY